MPGPARPARARVGVGIEVLLELQPAVEEVEPDNTRAREPVLRNGCKRNREGRRICQLFGERERRVGVFGALAVVSAHLRHPGELTADVHLLDGVEAGLLQGGTQDSIIPRKEMQQLYTAASEPKEIRWYPADHGLGRRSADERIDWLSDQLGLG